MPPRTVFAESGHSYYSGMIRGRTRFDISGRFRAAWKGDWKLIWTPFAPPDQEYALYNMKQDPEERENIAEKYPREVSELRADLDEWMKRSTRTGESPEPSLEDIEALRELGYIE